MAQTVSDNYTEIVALCEGKQDEVFLRRFLIRSGVNRHRIRIRPYPGGRGSGKQFVQEVYAKEVVEHRKRAPMMNIALIAMQDCDDETVEASRARLEGSAMRRPDERIALLFPRRNIETWIHFLNDNEVDESNRYPKLQRESDCHGVVDHLAAKHEYQISPTVPSFLRAACEEIRRIFPAKRCVESG